MKAYLQKPTNQELNTFLDSLKTATYSYPEVGATRAQVPKHYDNDQSSIRLGWGEKVWNQAKVALQAWQQYPQKWTEIYPSNAPLQEEQNVVVLFRLFGLWWRSSCRIVYTFDEPNRYGFAYGTLTEHVEMGEEVFYIERDDKGDIYYHIRAFSRPNFWLAKLGYPLARFYQSKFRRESTAAMAALTKEEHIEITETAL